MIPTAEGTPSRPAASPLRLFSCLRFDEVCVLQGAPLLGALFSMASLSVHGACVVAALMAGSMLLVAHVFVLNDWSGIHGDLRDPAREGRTFVAKGASVREAGWLAVVLLVAALLAFWAINPRTFTVAAAIAAVSALYSAPAFHMKGRPVVGSALHVAGGILHFLLGYGAFSPIDARGAAIGSFFALVFAAGHLTHEARGYEGDRLNGIRTNAVVFGKSSCFIAGLALFTAAYVLLATLAAVGLVPRVLLAAALLYPLHLAMSLRALRAGLTPGSLSRLQAGYRLVYAAIGLMMLVAQSWSLA